MLRSVCVFCGSSAGSDPRYLAAAQSFGRSLAVAHLRIVYGGASVGLMGALADAALEAGGEVIGVIPAALFDREIAHRGLSDLRVVTTMHERKAMMADLADAFVALPGGLGTLEELFEVWTWGMLGLHDKPYGLLNVGGFYDRLIGFLDSITAQGFVRPAQRSRLVVDANAETLLRRLSGVASTPAAGTPVSS
jgi:uncharacterized protein (TIGR00730 family)